VDGDGNASYQRGKVDVTRIQSLRLRDRIADCLREEIVCGKLSEGTPLRESPLAKRFDVSRGPIRDAILQLVSEGLVEDRPNRGARVGRVWDESTRPAMVKVRRDIEALALRQLMSREQELDLSPFRENLRHFELACRDEDLSAVVRLDMSFHRLILTLSGHPALESVWLPLMGGMRLPYSRHKSLMESHAEHQQIVNAIQNRQLRTALSALKANIQ
jgi:GntR family transcriptional regulator of gluconate operon